jgi:hypothetical protein
MALRLVARRVLRTADQDIRNVRDPQIEVSRRVPPVGSGEDLHCPVAARGWVAGPRAAERGLAFEVSGKAVLGWGVVLAREVM